MNIDLEKAKGEGFNLADIEILKDCEIKVNCADCAYFDEDLVEKCLSCINYDHIDNFKPKQSELDNLFVGAPVMVRNNHSHNFDLSQYSGEGENPKNIRCFDDVVLPESDDITCEWKYARLPTLKEAPRNVWLAPWVKFPEGLRHLKYILRHKNDVFTDTKWSEVEAVMILEDLKK